MAIEYAAKIGNMVRRRCVVMHRSRGLSLIEVLIALAISAVLLLATLLALRASFESYRRSAEQVSSSVAGRLVVERTQMLIRGGVDFGPLPSSLSHEVIESDELQIQSANGAWVTIRWDAQTNTLRWEQDGDSWVMLSGVTQSLDGGGPVSPFRLRFRDGRWLTHATLDLVVDGDAVAETDLDLVDVPLQRFVGSALPRRVAWME